MKKLFILFLVFVALILSGCEREGLINYDDCRETIYLSNNYEVEKLVDLRKFYSKFTCDDSKTEKGKTMGGYCYNLKTTAIFDKCKTVYEYYREPYKECDKGRVLQYDDTCDCGLYYSWSALKDRCVYDSIN